MSNAKKFLKSSVIYFAGNILTKLVAFFLLPIYTRLLPSEDMGYYDYSISLLNMLIPVICMEIWSGIMRFMFDSKEKEKKYKAVFNGLIIFLFSLFLYVIVFLVLGLIKDVRLIVLIFLYGFFVMLQNIYGAIARGVGLGQIYALSGIISSLVTAFTNIVLMLGFNLLLEALYIGAIIGFISQIIIIEMKVKVIPNIKFSMFDYAMIKGMLKFSLPLSLNSAFFWFLSSYNRVALTAQLGLSVTGMYAVAGKFTAFMTLVSTSFSLAWQELAYSKGNDKDRGTLYNVASNYYVKFLFAGLLLIVPFISIIFPFLIHENYADAYELVPLYLLATAASIFSSFLGNIFGAEKKTGIIMYSTVIAAIVNVITLHLLINRIGAQAANISLFLGFMTNIVIRIVMLRSVTKIKIDKRILFGFSILFCLSLYVYFVGEVILNIIFVLVVLVLCSFVFKELIQKALSAIKRSILRKV